MQTRQALDQRRGALESLHPAGVEPGPQQPSPMKHKPNSTLPTYAFMATIIALAVVIAIPAFT